MSRRDDRVLLQDMLEAAREAVSASQQRKFADLSRDRVWMLGLTKCVEIVGEAAAQVSPGYQQRYPEVPWAEMIAMRNRLVHAYFDISPKLLWSTVTEDLPRLIRAVEAILS